MNAAWQTILHTPWWVFILFFYLLKVGIDAIRPRIITMRKLFILPLLFLAFSIYSYLSSFPFTLITFSAYALPMLFGVGIGWLFIKTLRLKFDKQKGLVKMPGSYVTLLLILLIFSTKYYFGYSSTTDPASSEKLLFISLRLSVSGMCSGLLVGRLAGYLFRRSKSHHEDL